ncbi:cobalamin-binding protein [Natronomonas amylolytica]|uniref:cobalamin-binding protein n=1 Tax=Natronomonas amylolytica TaxID=3108498 RepID=UPI00300A9FB3
MRVVSLLPSATEIVYALGVEPVATSHECDYPPAAADRPSVVDSRIDADASSGDIDQQVQQAETEGGVYEIDREALAEADPDLVISQGICEVCAVDTVVVEEAIAELGLDCELLTTDPHSLADIFDDVRRIGEALGRADRADELVSDLQARVDRVADRAAESPVRPEVAVLDWLDPAMVAGHWVPELVELAGGNYGLADPGDASTPREWAEIREYDPDILVAAPCGFELDQTFANLADLTDREGWRQLRAVRMNRAYAMDGHHLVNRPGPRVVDTLEALAALVQPESFDVPEEWMAASLAKHPA